MFLLKGAIISIGNWMGLSKIKDWYRLCFQKLLKLPSLLRENTSDINP